MKKIFRCNNSAENAAKWLLKNKKRINDGGLSATICMEIPNFKEFGDD